MRKNLVIYGAGGLARETLWMINSDDTLSKEFNVLAFVVDEEFFNNTHSSVMGVTVKSSEYLYKEAVNDAPCVVIAIANAAARMACFNRLKQMPYLSFPPIVHPSCNIAPDAKIGDGTLIHTKCTITVGVTIGQCVLLNGQVTIGHDAVIDDFVTIMPRCDISGNVKIGKCASIGAKSFVLEGKRIGENATAAPGSIILRNVPPNVTVMGNPAKIFLKHNG